MALTRIHSALTGHSSTSSPPRLRTFSTQPASSVRRSSTSGSMNVRYESFCGLGVWKRALMACAWRLLQGFFWSYGTMSHSAELTWLLRMKIAPRTHSEVRAQCL
jgi:hypothetical protein